MSCEAEPPKPVRWRRRPPRTIHLQASGELVCEHRSTSCCPTCAAEHQEIIEVYGSHFWCASRKERADLARDIAKAEADKIAKGDPNAA